MLRRLLASPIDWFIVLIPLLITVTGIITIYTITYADYSSKLSNAQILYAAIGVVVLFALMFSNYRIFSSIAWLLYLIGIILLAMLVPPLSNILPFVDRVFGATRWINIGFFQLQPSELFKLLGIIVAAAFLAGRYVLFGLKQIALYFLLIGVPLVLILVEPNLGTTGIILGIFAIMFLAARPPMRIVALIFMALVIIMPIVFVNLKPYQKARLETFLSINVQNNANANNIARSKKENYNVNQALIAVGSGGLTGRGFGQGSQTVLNFLPVAHSDFIFAGFAEATGFLGAFALILLYTVLIWRIIIVAEISTDPFGRFITFGIAAKFFIQVVIHIGMNLGLLPVTGIPLPFMSSGGTALIVDLSAIGLVESIHIRHKKTMFD